MTTQKVVEYHRLSREEYDKLEKGMPIPHIGDTATPQQVGFLLGIQFVLQRLREGVVVG